MRYFAAIGSRYGALAVQFLLVLLVANRLPQTDAGLYFGAFGLVATLFCIVGLGLPDGLVVTVGQALSTGKTAIIRNALHRSLVRGLFSALIIFSLVAGGLILAEQDPSYAILTAIWGAFYGMVFVASQGLIALRAAALGSFFFYSATNLVLLCTSVPYLLLAQSPDLITLMGVTVVAASLATCAAIYFVWRKARGYVGTEHAELGQSARAGAIIALSRMMQSMIYWIPVWVATFLLGSAEAAVIATAGRLLIAVSAVIAALRFSVRPAIVAAAAQDDWAGIERLGRRISLATTIFTLGAILLLWLVGRPVLDLLFGLEYAAAWGVLMVLLVGALAEAIGGPVDEVLKMTGNSRVVFVGLLVTVACESLLAFLLAPHGLQAIAAAQSVAFAGMYGYLVMRLWQIRRILIVPVMPRKTREGGKG